MNSNGREQHARRAGRAFFGRSAELASLGAAFEDVLGAHPVSVLLAGDAGIGKSRLLEEFLDIARLREAIVAVGMCVPGDDALPYAPIVGILRDLAAIAPAAADLVGFAGGEVPDVTPDSADGVFAAMTNMGGGYGRTAFFEAILQLVVQIAQAGPIVLAVEDVHWCDSASAQLLDYLVRNVGGAPVLLICTYRPEDFAPDHPLSGWLAELGRSPRALQLAVGGLDQSEVAALLGEAAGGRVAPDFAASVWERSQGNPFYATELWAAGSNEKLPTALQTLILMRVRGLPARSQQLVNVAAAIGVTADHDLLAAVLGTGGDEFADDLAATIDGGVLVVAAEDCAYGFRHALMREAVYAALLPARRLVVHERIVAALHSDRSLCARTPSRRAAMLAVHSWAAGDWAGVIVPAIEAADAAAAVFAFQEADVHVGRALAALDRLSSAGPVPSVDRQALVERAAEYAYFAGTGHRALELAQRAAAQARDSGDVVAEARCRLLIARSAWGVGDSKVALDSCQAAVALQSPNTPTELLARAMAEQARGSMLMSQFGTGAAQANEAIAVADAVSARAVAAHARCTLAVCIGAEGRIDEGIELVRAALEVAEDLVLPEDLNRAYGNLSHLLLSADRLEEAAAIAFDAQAMGEEIGGVRMSSAASNSIEALTRLGRWDDAETALDRLGLTPFGSCAAGPFVGRLPLAMSRGMLDEADELLQTAHEIADGMGDVQTSALVCALHAQLEIERGNPERAVQLAREAVQLIEDSEEDDFMPRVCYLGIQASADRRDAARGGALADAEDAQRDAREFLDLAEAAVERIRARASTVPPYPAALMLLCRAELSRLGQSDGEQWRLAAEAFVSSPDAYLAAYCKWREAEALLEARGSRARAGESLSDAAKRSRALRTAPLTARIEELATRTRIDLEVPAPPEPDARASAAAELGLTAREAEILGQLASGCTDQEIASTLFISKKTVRVHVTNILRKLQVANRVEAGRIGQRLGTRATPVG